MIKPTYLVLSIALFCCYQPSRAESIMNKCTDGTEITYTDKPCEKLGLKSAGPIKNTVTITPALPIPQVPRNKIHKKDVSETETPASSVLVDNDVYQCTTYNGVVSFSSNPCPEFAYVPQFGFNKPVQQQVISRKLACEKISANPKANFVSNLSCL